MSLRCWDAEPGYRTKRSLVRLRSVWVLFQLLLLSMPLTSPLPLTMGYLPRRQVTTPSSLRCPRKANEDENNRLSRNCQCKPPSRTANPPIPNPNHRPNHQHPNDQPFPNRRDRPDLFPPQTLRARLDEHDVAREVQLRPCLRLRLCPRLRLRPCLRLCLCLRLRLCVHLYPLCLYRYSCPCEYHCPSLLRSYSLKVKVQPPPSALTSERSVRPHQRIHARHPKQTLARPDAALPRTSRSPRRILSPRQCTTTPALEHGLVRQLSQRPSLRSRPPSSLLAPQPLLHSWELP